MKSTLLSVVRTGADLLFPPRCVHCRADGSLFCGSCVAESTRLDPRRSCRTCALPSNLDICEACFVTPPLLNRAIAVFTYEPAVREAVTALKYRDIRALAPVLGAMMADALPDSVKKSVDVIAPVPAGRSKMRSRGYNQSELLAKRVSGLTGITVSSNLLERTVEGSPQAKASNIRERIDNVKGAFTADTDAEGMRVLLIDDVMTTGSTLNACARALKDARAEWVGALTLAREL